MVGCGALVVGGGSVCGDCGVLALVMDFREVMLMSPAELAHCASPPPPILENVLAASAIKSS